MGFFLYRIIRTIFGLYTLILFARAVLPLLGMSYVHPVMQFLLRVTEPLLMPIRRRLPPTGGIDLSPLVLILIMWLLEQILGGLLLTWVP